MDCSPNFCQRRDSPGGNGVLGLGTFVAIITGTVLAGILSDTFKRDQTWSGVVLIVLAILGTLTSRGISRLPAADPNKRLRVNFVPEVIAQVRGICRDRVLALAVLGGAYFWFLGALLQLAILFYGKDVLSLSDTRSGLLQVSLAIGIGLGSLAAGYLSGRKIEYGLIPLGALGLSLFGLLLSRAGLGFGSVALNLGLLGFFGGFYIVPIQALIQQRPDRKGERINHRHFGDAFVHWCVPRVVRLLRVGRLAPLQIFLMGGLITLTRAS